LLPEVRSGWFSDSGIEQTFLYRFPYLHLETDHKQLSKSADSNTYSTFFSVLCFSQFHQYSRFSVLIPSFPAKNTSILRKTSLLQGKLHYSRAKLHDSVRHNELYRLIPVSSRSNIVFTPFFASQSERQRDGIMSRIFIPSLQQFLLPNSIT